MHLCFRVRCGDDLDDDELDEDDDELDEDDDCLFFFLWDDLDFGCFVFDDDR